MKMMWCQMFVVMVAEVAARAQAGTLYYSSENVDPQGKQTVPSSDAVDSHVYLFAADGKKRPYSFVNEFGELVGFDVDIVDEVCQRAGKRCHTVLAAFTECIFTDRSIDYTGRGLWADWFDGCPGYQITVDRQNEFDFTLPYLDSSASFTVAPGNPSNFNPDFTDYSAFKLLHLTGAPTNTECLRRLHKKFGQVLVAQDLPQAKSWLLDGTADVLFSPRNQIDGLDVLPKRVHCDIGGAGIMVKKGSLVPSWWNPVYQKYYLSGEYTKLCDDAASKYGGKIQCLPSPEEITPELSALMAEPQKPIPDKLWKFVVSGRIPPYSYLDDDGKLKGFTPDMLTAVCEVAGKSCVLLLAQVPECSVRIGELLYPGRGLMEGWFDACTGYFVTQDRDNSWDFTAPYLQSNDSFLVLQGNPRGFDPDSGDYSSFTIVYQATAITNKHCLNRLHKKCNTLIVVENKEEAIAMVLNGTADTWFTKEDHIDELEQLPQHLHCEYVGTGIMTRKGSELPSWWNQAFEEFYSTGGYRDFCEEEGRLHNYVFPCIEGPAKSADIKVDVQKG